MTAILDFAASAWIPVAFLFCATLYFRCVCASWMAPASFLGLFWVANLAASLLAVDHTVPALGIWVLAALIFGFQLGTLLVVGGSESMQRPPAGSQSLPATPVRLRQFSIFLTAIAMLGIIYFVAYSLDLFGLPFDFLSIVQMAAKWTLLRYDAYADPWTLRLAAVWIYPPALLGGILLPLRQSRRDTLVALSSLVPSLLYTLLTGGRAAFLVGMTCWLGGYWSVRAALGRSSLRLFRIRTLIAMLVSATALLFLFLAVNSFRSGSNLSDVTQLGLDYNSGQVRNYMFGAPAAFAEWFNRGDETPLSWGAFTFPGLFDALHIQKKTLGTYTDSEPTVGLEGTNIYTLFRGLIQDFGLFGALAVCVLAGYVSALAYHKRGLRVSWLLCLAGFYAFAIFSPLFCLFGFNGPIFAWLLAWLGLGNYAKFSLTPQAA